LGLDSIRTWKQLEEQFHVQYHSEAAEAGIADLAQVRQKRGETVAEYIQRFKEVKNRCYSIRISEKEAVELATLGLVKPIRDLVFQLQFNSLAHLVQKMTIYEQRHPELYQDKFKRQVVMVDAEDSEDFEYVVMTFGLKNAGATYQRAMNYMFHDLIGKLVEIYIDDVVVKSASAEGYLGDLRAAGRLGRGCKPTTPPNHPWTGRTTHLSFPGDVGI
jgi:hypothetical protein